MFGTIGFKCAGTFVDFHCRNFLRWWSSRDVGISPRVSPKWPDGWPNSWGSLQRRFLLTKRGPVYQNQTGNTETFNLCEIPQREIHSHVDGEKSSVELFFLHPAWFFFVAVFPPNYHKCFRILVINSACCYQPESLVSAIRWKPLVS